MRLNTLSPAEGSKKENNRVGRGIGSGSGKTAGRGHKGQKSRSGGKVRRGFEGGQTPLYRRLPKFGFTSRKSFLSAEVRLNEIAGIDAEKIDINTLKSAGLIAYHAKSVKVILSGEINKAVHLKGLYVTKGAKVAIESAGGKIEE